MPRNDDTVEIQGFVYRQTDSAYHFSDGTVTDEYGNTEKVWLPKSQCEWYPSGEEQAGLMTVPEWLALEKGLI